MKRKMTGAAGLAAAFVAGMSVATALGGWMTGSGAVAQGQQVKVERVITPTVTDEDIALLRKDLRAMKMQVIGQNMSLSEDEGQKFWPIYNHYVRDLQEVNNQKYALLKQYAEMWATMSDQDAMIYVRHWLEVDGQAQALRLKYVPTVSQVLPGRKAATFFQLDRRLNMIIDLQLFSQIPLAHVKESAESDSAHP
jgi:Mg-chelatase subunit ChlI